MVQSTIIRIHTPLDSQVPTSTGPHAMFYAEKSACSKTTVTVCSNLAHLCNIHLVVLERPQQKLTLQVQHTVTSVTLATNERAQRLQQRQERFCCQSESAEQQEEQIRWEEIGLDGQLRLPSSRSWGCNKGAVDSAVRQWSRETPDYNKGVINWWSHLGHLHLSPF